MAVANAVSHTAGVLAEVRAELAARRPQAAIRRFEHLLAQGQAAPQVRLTDWITSEIGREGLSHLALAYATSSCPSCDRGMVGCAACKGAGRNRHGVVCRTCLGMRRAPCASCSGDGLSSYGICPDGLRPLVLSYRLCVAASEVAKLAPEQGGLLPEMTVEGCLRRVANLNKLAAVLENAAVEVVGQQARGLISPARLQRVKHRIGGTHHRLAKSIREALERIVELSSHAGDSDAPDLLFYRWLARSEEFEGTALQRQFAARHASQQE